MRAPSKPTDSPLNVRSPLADMENTPITRPRISIGRVDLHQRLRHGIEGELDEACDEQQGERKKIASRPGEAAERDAPDHRQHEGGARLAV